MVSGTLTSRNYNAFLRAVSIDLGLYRFDQELAEAGLNGATNKLMDYRAVQAGIERHQIMDPAQRNAYAFRCIANEAHKFMQNIPGHPHQILKKIKVDISKSNRQLLQRQILQIWDTSKKSYYWGLAQWHKQDIIRQPRVNLELLYLELPPLLELGKNRSEQIPACIQMMLTIYDAPMSTAEMTRVMLDLFCLRVTQIDDIKDLDKTDDIYEELLLIIGDRLNQRQRHVLRDMLEKSGLDSEDKLILAHAHQVTVRSIELDMRKIGLLLMDCERFPGSPRPNVRKAAPKTQPEDEFQPHL
jgi:hypothetical protein